MHKSFSLLFVLTVLLSNGCLPQATREPTQRPTDIPPTEVATTSGTSTVDASTPTATATAPPATPTPSCSQAGTIEANVVPNDDFGRDLPYQIYLPPCYQQIQGSLPTLYLLHGLGGDDQQWLDLGIAETADALITDEVTPPFLMVFPWQQTGLEDEVAIIEGLLPHVEDNYRALPAGGWRAIGGLSRGGGWALRLGLKHPSNFYRIGLHSPAPRSGDLTSIALWLDQNQGNRKPFVWIDIGDQDSLLPAAEAIAARLDDLRYDYEFSVRQGDHQAEYWRTQLEDYLRWYSARW